MPHCCCFASRPLHADDFTVDSYENPCGVFPKTRFPRQERANNVPSGSKRPSVTAWRPGGRLPADLCAAYEPRGGVPGRPHAARVSTQHSKHATTTLPVIAEPRPLSQRVRIATL